MRQTFTTNRIPLAAWLTVAGFAFTITRGDDGRTALFVFSDSSSLHDAVIAYERGASLPGNKLFHEYTRLYREAGRIARGV